MTTINLTTTVLGEGPAVVVSSDQPLGLSDLDRADLFPILATAGALVLRGFRTDVEGFNDLVARCSSKVISDPAREYHGEAAQKVDAGYDSVGLHLENGNSPFMPTLTWFYSQTAAARGSATTICDGYRAFERLDAEAQSAFSDQEIVYSRTVPKMAWKRLVQHLQGGDTPSDQITLADLEAAVEEPERTTLRLNPDGSLYYAFRTPAVRTRTLFGAEPAFANSILGPSNNYEAPVIEFADGTPITADLLRTIETATSAVTEDIVWHDGDVALIDNTRVMHGRRKIEDPARTIFNAQSYALTEV